MALIQKAARQPGRYGFCQRGKHHYEMGTLLHPHPYRCPWFAFWGDRAEEREGGRAAKDGYIAASDLEWESVGAPVGRDER
jgi:hypothetical protein